MKQPEYLQINFHWKNSLEKKCIYRIIDFCKYTDFFFINKTIWECNHSNC